MKTCEFVGCSNSITPQARGARIGYTVNNLNREVHACQECAMKVMTAPRGTFYVSKHRELILNLRPTIIT
jgi:hypothetical protein